MITRRNFIKRAVLSTAAVSFGGVLEGFSAKSYNNIVGSNERIRAGVIGVNSRGMALACNFAKQENCEVIGLCDVDARALQKCYNAVQKIKKAEIGTYKDLRNLLENKKIDAVIIATPDHWHAPAALLALKAGKHVYLEKPCSHSPAEGEMLIKGVKKYGLVMQMGNQRRSWPNVVEAIEELKNGIIGNVYYGKCWYTNNRPSIGIGKEVPVPEWFDWDLWQGPAPRTVYKDNIHPYNWHWFWRWGTGEALNNGTHMIDLLRWGMEEEYPKRVESIGGRYRYKDDWETPDTQVISCEFDDGRMMTWEGRSCNGQLIEGSSVGAMFYGDKGSLLITGSNAYTVYDLKSKVIKDVKSQIAIDPRNLMNPAEQLDALHIQNFFDAIRKSEPLHSDIVSGHKSTLLMQLGNIAQRVGRSIEVDSGNGHICMDKEALTFWSRTYEPGWEMKL